jgi:hypothetical protein
MPARCIDKPPYMSSPEDVACSHHPSLEPLHIPGFEDCVESSSHHIPTGTLGPRRVIVRVCLPKADASHWPERTSTLHGTE